MAGQGQWRVLASVHGVPAIYGTYLRPDSVHTSYLAGIASMDPRLLTFQLRPGQVVGVRQNLKLIVDHGSIPASVDQDVQSQ